MVLICIQECSEQAGIFQAKVSFDQRQAYDVTICDPFSKEKEERLEWYFEEHLRFPFTDQVKTQDAAASITEYGEKLFAQVFTDNPQVLSAYETVAKAELYNLEIEIIGQPSFHMLHWETLKDPKHSLPLALQATIIRKNLSHQTIHTNIPPSPTVNLLVVTARPQGKQDISCRTISRPLIESLRQDRFPVRVDILRPGTYKALENHLRATTEQYGAGHYHIIHFDVHGSLLTYDSVPSWMRNQRYGRDKLQPFEGTKAFLFLEGERNDTADPLEATELANLLRVHQISIVILNACQSGKQAGESEASLASHLMQSGVQMVLAMGYSVTTTAAELLMKTFYQQLFEGRELSVAIRLARCELYNHKRRRAYFSQEIDLEDWMLPVVYQNQPQHLAVRPFMPEENALFKEKEAKRYTPTTQPTYGFVGRDLDILQIEKRLLTRRNLVLLRGMGGVGKTTLLHHLAFWWQQTGLIKQGFYFGYDEHAWTYQQLITEMAQKLLGRTEYLTTFQPLSPEKQQEQLIQLLRSTAYLLILDNLESVTGTPLSVRHTLSEKEQEFLHNFLTEVVGGKTLILLGSRSAESWLAKGTFEDNIYDLPGLDPEAASILTERILEQHKATHYRQDKDLQALIKLLDGFPLALEVVLANLAQQTPTQVLIALQAGDVTLKVGESDKRTENILRCIDYSYNNLSLESQQLLLCLAPFTSVFNLGALDTYATHLKNQPALESLPVDRLLEVVQEAMRWGLFNADPDVPSFLRIQPVLPYFLRNRFFGGEQQQQQIAIEKAFQDHYQGFSIGVTGLFLSKNAEHQRVGLALARLEYENLITALRFALREKASIANFHDVLDHYLDHQQDHQRGQELDLLILHSLEPFLRKDLSDLPEEYVHILGKIGNRQIKLKQYDTAIKLNQKILQILETSNAKVEQRRRWKANAYLHLGVVAQEQRRWQAAEEYYQQALPLFAELNDLHHLAGIYFNSATLAREQRKWQEAERYCHQALQLFIEDNDLYQQADTYLNLGALAKDQDKWQEAEGYSKQALSIYAHYNDYSRLAMVYSQLGIVAQNLQKWTEAERYCQQALQIFVGYNDRHNQAKIYQELGIVAQKLGKWKEAEGYYQQALRIFGEYNDLYSQAAPYCQLGFVMKMLGQQQEAEGYYRQALQIFGEYNDRHSQAKLYLLFLGVMIEEQEKWQEAADLFMQSLSIFREYKDSENSSVALINLARLWHKSNDTSIPEQVASVLGMPQEEVEKLLQERLKYRDLHDAPAYAKKGADLVALGRNMEALEACEKAIELDPALPLAYVSKGTALVVLNRDKEALEACEKAIELDPTLPLAYVSKGIALVALNRGKEALETYEKAIELDPTLPPAYLNKGMALLNLGQDKEALEACEKAIELDPKLAQAYAFKGFALGCLERYEEALVTYDQAIQLNSQLVIAYIFKGTELYELGRYEEALAAYRKVIDLDPTQAYIYYRMGQTFQYLGRSREADRAYERAQQLGYSEEG